MDLAVAQQDHAGQSLRRHVDQGRAHRLDQARAARPFAAELDVRRRQHGFADFESFLLAEFPLQHLARGLDLLAPFADRHRIAVVDDDQGHVGDRLALLFDQFGSCECGQYDHDRAQPHQGAARAGAQAKQHQPEADRGHDGKRLPRDHRIEGDGGGRCGVHRMSLCMMSWMWTWSSL